MAIIIERDSQNNALWNIFIFIFFTSIFGACIYYLFFSKVPGIEYIAPVTLKDTKDIADIKFDPSSFISSPALSNLKNYTDILNPQEEGRSNPFIN